MLTNLLVHSFGFGGVGGTLFHEQVVVFLHGSESGVHFVVVLCLLQLVFRVFVGLLLRVDGP